MRRNMLFNRRLCSCSPKLPVILHAEINGGLPFCTGSIQRAV
jgi:hypothetical protein